MTIDDLADHLAATNGTVTELRQQLDDLTTRLDAPRLAQAILPDLALDDQVLMLLQAERPEQWCTESAVRCLATAWPDARKRLLLATAARKCGVTPGMLAGLVEQWQGEGSDDLAGLGTINGRTLLTTDYARRQDVIAEVLPAGCTLLAGNAKDGKSLLAYHLAACVATGRPFLGQFPVQPGEVLFFALEDGERRGQERLRRQAEQLGVEPEAFEQIHFRFWDAPKLGMGFERVLVQWITEHPETRLIIIDILEKIRPPRSEFAELYRTGYATTAPLTRVAQEQNVALLVVHHSNKNPHADPRLLVSGPMSVLGGADNAWLLRRPYGEEEAELIIAGRDIPEQEWALRFADGLWSLDGTLSACRMSRERREVLEVLAEEPGGLKPYQLAQAMGKKASSMRSLLRKMREEGQVSVSEEGLYTALVDPPGVHGVHGVPPASACTDAREACMVATDDQQVMMTHQVIMVATDDQQVNTDHEGHARHADHDGHPVHAVHADHARHPDYSSHGDDGDHARHADHPGTGVHPGHAVHADHTLHTEHPDHAGRARHAEHVDTGEHRMHAVHAMHADDAAHDAIPMHAMHATVADDPFLDPDSSTEDPFVPGFPDPEAAQVSTPAQGSTTAQADTAAHLHSPVPPDTPLQVHDWFLPCLESGVVTSRVPWQAVEIATIPNGKILVYGLTPSGKLNRWPYEQCRKVPPPEDTR